MLKVKFQDNYVQNNTVAFRDLKIGDVFIVMSTVTPSEQSCVRPSVYMKTACIYGITYANSMDLKSLTTAIINGSKRTKLVKEATLNITI